MNEPNGNEESPTERLPAAGPRPAPAATGELASPLVQPRRERCPVCGAGIDADQRYCVECGQRLAPARMPFAPDARHASPPPAPPPRRRLPPAGANAALIGGVFTLLLAMGVGVLIGRSAQATGGKGGQIQYVTGAAVTASTQTESTTTSATRSGKEGSSGGATAKAAASSKPTKVATRASNPTESIGTPGSGQGYQHGHFTGHFFGNESESEEAGEAEEEPRSGKK
jgi:hypothetical protein